MDKARSMKPHFWLTWRWYFCTTHHRRDQEFISFCAITDRNNKGVGSLVNTKANTCPINSLISCHLYSIPHYTELPFLFTVKWHQTYPYPPEFFMNKMTKSSHQKYQRSASNRKTGNLSWSGGTSSCLPIFTWVPYMVSTWCLHQRGFTLRWWVRKFLFRLVFTS